MNTTIISAFIIPLLLTAVPIILFSFCFEDSYYTLFMILILALTEQYYLISNAVLPGDIPLIFLMASTIIFLILKLINWEKD
jgi:hypothetical protein